MAKAVPTPVAASDSFGRMLHEEMMWVWHLIDGRFNDYFKQGRNVPNPDSLAAPALQPGASRYADLVLNLDLSRDERIMLALALAPHIAPQALDLFFLKNATTDRGYAEFGGVKGVHHAGFLPTGETALFLLCGDNFERRLAVTLLLDPDRPLFAQRVLRLGPASEGEPTWSGALMFSAAFLRHLVTGEEPRPELGASFPAKRIATRLTWDDLVLDIPTRRDILEIEAWARFAPLVRDEWGIGNHIKPGFRALFHGPPGTGKTLTASLLGQKLQRDVYRIDLSQVVSKFIGETEKNLSVVFAEAEHRNWILFFDEADALFGKRTATTSSHDRYANQEVSYLLQRVEDHDGVVILATNLKSNLDDAFVRRFQAIVHFHPPDVAQRRDLWRRTFGPKVKLAPDVDFAKLARDHEVTGGQIINVVLSACLAAAARPEQTVTMADITRALSREVEKEGRSP